MKIIALLLAILTLSSCKEAGTYTLYRNSNISVGDVKGEDLRIHVATFNSEEGETYNKQTCDLTRSLFQSQPDVQTKFWCEEGGFRENVSVKN